MPKLEIRNLLIAIGIMTVTGVPAFAQVQTQPAELAEKLKTIMPQVVPQGTNGSASDPLDPPPSVRSPEAELLTQKNRQMDRQRELADGGFKWSSWFQVNDAIVKFINERDPQDIYLNGNPKYRDFAVADVDRDNQPDILVYDWSECVAAGCQFTIYFNNTAQKPVSFIGHDLKPMKNGVTLDGTPYEF